MENELDLDKKFKLILDTLDEIDSEAQGKPEYPQQHEQYIVTREQFTLYRRLIKNLKH